MLQLQCILLQRFLVMNAVPRKNNRPKYIEILAAMQLYYNSNHNVYVRNRHKRPKYITIPIKILVTMRMYGIANTSVQNR